MVRGPLTFQLQWDCGIEPLSLGTTLGVKLLQDDCFGCQGSRLQAGSAHGLLWPLGGAQVLQDVILDVKVRLGREEFQGCTLRPSLTQPLGLTFLW